MPSMADRSGHVTGYPATTGYPPPHAHSSTNPNGGFHQNQYTTATPVVGTAYPYAAPPPQPHHYNPNPNAPPFYSPRATFLRRFLAILVALFIIFGTVAFIVWLVLRPRLPEFRLDSLSLSNFNVTPSSMVSGDWDARLTVLNPNHKMKLYYDRIEAAVFYRSESLAETTIPPFDQATKNLTQVRATFAANSAYVERWVENDVNQEQRTHGNVNFNMRLLARVRFKAGAWQARRRYLRVYCGDLIVGMQSNKNSTTTAGALVGGPKQCRVGL